MNSPKEILDRFETAVFRLEVLQREVVISGECWGHGAVTPVRFSAKSTCLYAETVECVAAAGELKFEASVNAWALVCENSWVEPRLCHNCKSEQAQLVVCDFFGASHTWSTVTILLKTSPS